MAESCCAGNAACCPPVPAGAGADAPTAGTTLEWRDRLGALKVRFGIGRNRYRVEPGLYRVGAPDRTAPVLVTANYKLTFDAVRKELGGIDTWLLVLDTKGINVWCAAGKGTFGTKELCTRVLQTDLFEVVDHNTLILPQLGAPGVAAHEVKTFTGFRVVYGPVRAADIPAFLEAGMKTTPEMRQVTFNLNDRVTVTGTELALAFQPKVLAAMAAVVLASGIYGLQFSWRAVALRGGAALLAGIGGVIAGGFVTPVLLPWIPGRMFAVKGALVGAVFGAGLYALAVEPIGPIAALGAALALTVIASYMAMNFTGTSAITSPSGVQHEMTRVLPWQIAGAAIAALLWIISAFI